MKVSRALGVAVLIIAATVPTAFGAPGDRELTLTTPGGSGAFDAFISDASADGSRTIISTPEPNAALGDTDASLNVFERAANGSLRLISFPGSGAFIGSYQGMSDDGSRIWFTTAEPNLDFGDDDIVFDVYERSSNGALRLITSPVTSRATGRGEETPPTGRACSSRLPNPPLAPTTTEGRSTSTSAARAEHSG